MKNRRYLEKVYRKVTRTGKNRDLFLEGQNNKCDLALKRLRDREQMYSLLCRFCGFHQRPKVTVT